MRHRACAATLLRDAACVALLLGVLGGTARARNYLHDSGGHFLELGLAAGSALIVLADVQESSSKLECYSDVIEGIRHQWSRKETEKLKKPERPMTYTARSSLRQMFSQLQADQLMTEISEHQSMWGESLMHQVLKRNGGYPVGNTGLSIGSYMKIAEWIVKQRSTPVHYVPDFVTASFATLATTRAEYIRTAREDKFHWRMLMQPAELLDFDSVILMYLALGAQMSEDALQALHWADEAEIIRAPLIVAQQLRYD